MQFYLGCYNNANKPGSVLNSLAIYSVNKKLQHSIASAYGEKVAIL